MNNQKGFTIIELIVVIAIIAVLAGIVLVNVQGYINRAKDVKKLSDAENYVKALSMYFADNNGHYPPQLGCCLGNNTGGLPCSGSGFCTSNNVALAPYFSSLPADNYAVGGVANVGGYVYSQASVDGGGVTAYNLDWFMNGTVGVNCGVGKVVSVNQIPPGSTTGFTVCRYTSQ